MVSLFGVLCLSSPTTRLTHILQGILLLTIASDLLFLLSFSRIWVTLSPQHYTSGSISKTRYYDSWNQLGGLHTMAFIFTVVSQLINAIVVYLLRSVDQSGYVA